MTEIEKRKNINKRRLIPGLESRMVTISQNLYCAIWYRGIETIIFRYLLDPDALNETLNYSALPLDCDKQQVLLLIEELKFLWQHTKHWYNGEVIFNEKEWKAIYNKEAVGSGWVILG